MIKTVKTMAELKQIIDSHEVELNNYDNSFSYDYGSITATYDDCGTELDYEELELVLEFEEDLSDLSEWQYSIGGHFGVDIIPVIDQSNDRIFLNWAIV